MTATQESPDREGNVKTPDGGSRTVRFIVRVLVSVLLPLVVLAGAGTAARYLIETGPKAHRQPPPRQAKLVEVQPAVMSSEPTTVHAMGTVIAARTADVQPRVSGQIIEVSEELMPGGVFKAGDSIVRLDPTDFELIVRQRVP